MKQSEIWLIDLDPANGLSKTSAADCFQIRSLSQDRLLKKLGDIDSATLQEIKEALSKVLDL